MKYHETFSFIVCSKTVGFTACLLYANIFNNISQFFTTVEVENRDQLWVSSKQPTYYGFHQNKLDCATTLCNNFITVQ